MRSNGDELSTSRREQHYQHSKSPKSPEFVIIAHCGRASSVIFLVWRVIEKKEANKHYSINYIFSFKEAKARAMENINKNHRVEA